MVKQRLTITLPRQQQGVAAIMFVIMLPVLMGFITLGVEGGRYLALKGQFRDAAEVASLAISARGSENDSENQKLAEAVVRSMIPDMKHLSVTVQRKECQANSQCGGSHDDRRFYQYAISIASTHRSWFPDWTGDGMGFADNMTMSADATSRKYYGSGVDVVFVADFSGSMNCAWGVHSCTGNQENSKIKLLKETVKDVAIKLKEYSETLQLQEKNTMALVPFVGITRNKEGSSYCEVSQLNLNDGEPHDTLIDNAIKDGNMFKEKECKRISNGDNKSGNLFYTLALTSDAENFNQQLNAMSAGGWTASYEGIIRASQIALKGKNPSRLIIVLSDGQDVGPNNSNALKSHFYIAHQKLLARNYCDKIRTRLNSETVSEKPVQSRIAVIGIGYDAERDPNLANCAGPGNVFTAKDMNDVYDLLLTLISNSEEVGHLYFNDAVSSDRRK